MPLTKSKPKRRSDLSFIALGTQWNIETSVPLDDSVALRIQSELEAYEKIYSRFRTDSLVSQMAGQSGTFTFPADFQQLFQLYVTCHDLTDGAMNPLVGRALEQLGYDKEYSLKPTAAGAVPTLMDAISWDENVTLKTSQPVVFDVGAAGKGQAVDRVAAILKNEITGAFTVDASGDMYHYGDDAEIIGLEHPFDQTKVIGTATIKNKALCASASNRRAWAGMHHIIDARTRRPTINVVASWVVANTAMTADGLATALFFVDSTERLAEHFDFSYVRMFANGTVDYSDNFEGELFI